MARLCVLRQYYYPNDQRVRNQVSALLAEGHEVDVICLRRPGQNLREQTGGLTVWRLPLSHTRSGKLAYIMQYSAFFLLSMVMVSVLFCTRRYAVVNAHSMPDGLVFAAIVPRLLGARVVLDLHEAMPEFFATKYKVATSSPFVRLLAWIEQASIKFAHLTITCNTQMRSRFIERGADPSKIGVVMNSADEAIFHFPNVATRAESDPAGTFTLISHGSLEERYGLDTAIKAVGHLKHEFPNLRLEIYGEGSYERQLRELVRQEQLEDTVRFHGFVPLNELLLAIGRADAGIVAMKRDIFRDLTHCLKMFEYISMRKPVICSRTRAVEECFDEDALLFFNSDDAQDLARALQRLMSEPGLAAQLVSRATTLNATYSWPRQREIFLSMLRPLLGGDASPSMAVSK